MALARSVDFRGEKDRRKVKLSYFIFVGIGGWGRKSNNIFYVLMANLTEERFDKSENCIERKEKKERERR